ncbi:universal stress protein family protein [Motilibacter peucedani]|uniref:Universal stress protein family protein n=1 Tax=Motilibacter peucedani TaxID=598650 RepID=A0A420XP37_9ACTN|nr:universal stress protein [Motilibacter peucedani]RKS73932.1 universal stress protein family protein [Motilibacter peucedani]
MTILVGYVPTDAGNAALSTAVSEAKLRSTGLLLVNTATGGNFAAGTFADEKDIDSVVAAIEEEGVSVTVRQLPDANPADALLSASEEAGIELLVIGLRRRSAVAKLVMGSTAQRLLLEASCPVLAVKAPL